MIKKIVFVFFAFNSVLSFGQDSTKVYDDKSGSAVTPNRQKNANYMKSNVNPSFPGGQDSLYAFINRNIRLPIRSELDKDSIFVIVGYEISPFGRVKDVEIIGNGFMEDLNLFQKEAIRVVSLLPNWQPALYNGSPTQVSTYLVIPFIYKEEK